MRSRLKNFISDTVLLLRSISHFGIRIQIRCHPLPDAVILPEIVDLRAV